MALATRSLESSPSVLGILDYLLRASSQDSAVVDGDEMADRKKTMTSQETEKEGKSALVEGGNAVARPDCIFQVGMDYRRGSKTPIDWRFTKYSPLYSPRVCIFPRHYTQYNPLRRPSMPAFLFIQVSFILRYTV